MRVSNPNRLPLEIARDVWKQHAKAFFCVTPLARSPRFACACAELDMILPSHCAQLLPDKRFSGDHIMPLFISAGWRFRRTVNAFFVGLLPCSLLPDIASMEAEIGDKLPSNSS